MEGEGGGAVNSSSDSGSGGIIDVSTVSSNFSVPTPQATGGWMTEDEEGKRGVGRSCPLSVEKVWFTDTSTGVWLLEEEESGGYEVPDEFLDVSMESGEEEEEEEEESKETYSSVKGEGEELSNEDSEKGSSREDEEDVVCNGRSSTEVIVDKPQLCGWVPPQCCLIPLPDSPCDSDDEIGGGGGEGERRMVNRLSSSELQREQEKELEVLFGYKPPSNDREQPPVESEERGGERVCDNGGDVFNGGKVGEEEEEEKMVGGGVAKPRSNSTDSGVVSISPHSSEGGDVEQRPNHHQTVILTTAAGAEGGGGGGGGVELTPRKCSQKPHPPVSRLRTPSVNRSVFNSLPVVSSELEEMKEASKMAFPPLLSSSSSSPPPSSTTTTAITQPNSHHKTFTVTPQDSTTATDIVPTSTVSSSSSSSSSVSRSVDGGHDVSLVSATSSTTSQESTDHQPLQKKKKKMEKKLSSTSLAKPAIRGTFSYKANPIAPSVKIVKRPPSSTKLKSLLSASAVPSVLPSQVKKPPPPPPSSSSSSSSSEQFKHPANPPPSQTGCLDNRPGTAAAAVAVNGGQRRRKTSAPPTRSSSSQFQPLKKVVSRRSFDRVSTQTSNPVQISRSRPSSASNSSCPGLSGPGPIKISTRPGITSPGPNKTITKGIKSKLNSSTPTKQTRGCIKQQQQQQQQQAKPGTKRLNTTFDSESASADTIITKEEGEESSTVASDDTTRQITCTSNTVIEKSICGKSSDLNFSIVSNCSPSIQQSTPLRLDVNSMATRPGAVVKAAASTTVTKDTSSLGNSRHSNGNPAIPVTPRSSIASVSGRRGRPTFSLSSIDSEGGPPLTTGSPVLSQTFTEDPYTHPPPPPSSSTIVESTPKQTKKKRRSFIPTPARQYEVREVAPLPLIYSSDKPSSTTTNHQAPPTSPISRRKHVSNTKPIATATNCTVAGKRKSLVPGPRPRRPLVARNKMAVGGGGLLVGKKQQKTRHDGPLKPMSVYKYSFTENSEPPLPTTAKVVHSPVNKDDQPASPHSAWSPVRRKPVAEGEAIYQCTKRGHRN